MKKRLIFALAILFATLLRAMPVAQDNDDDDDNPTGALQQKETIQKSFTLSGTGERYLDVDNVFGSIEIVAAPSDQIQVTANRTIHGETKAEMERAKKEVTLDITQEGNIVKLYVNGPFRCNNN